MIVSVFQPQVMCGEQLVHSVYLQRLASLAVGLQLDHVLCSLPAPLHHPPDTSKLPANKKRQANFYSRCCVHNLKEIWKKKCISQSLRYNAAFGIAQKFVQTTGKHVRTSGTRSFCFTCSDVLGCKKQTTTKVNKTIVSWHRRPLRNEISKHF